MADPSIQSPPCKSAVHARQVRDCLAKCELLNRNNGIGEEITEEEKDAICLCLWSFVFYIEARMGQYEFHLLTDKDLKEQREHDLPMVRSVTRKSNNIKERIFMLGGGGPRDWHMSSNAPGVVIDFTHCDTVYKSIAMAHAELKVALERMLSFEKSLLESRSRIADHTSVCHSSSPGSHFILTGQLYYSDAMRNLFFSLKLDHESEVMFGPDLSQIVALRDPRTSEPALPASEEERCLICWNDRNTEAPDYDMWWPRVFPERWHPVSGTSSTRASARRRHGWKYQTHLDHGPMLFSFLP